MNWNTGRSCRKDPVTFTQAGCRWHVTLPHSQMHEFASPFSLQLHVYAVRHTLVSESGGRTMFGYVQASEREHFFRAVALARISTSVLWFQLTSRVCQLLFARLWDWQPEPTVFRGLSHAGLRLGASPGESRIPKGAAAGRREEPHSEGRENEPFGFFDEL